MIRSGSKTYVQKKLHFENHFANWVMLCCLHLACGWGCSGRARDKRRHREGFADNGRLVLGLEPLHKPRVTTLDVVLHHPSLIPSSPIELQFRVGAVRVTAHSRRLHGTVAITNLRGTGNTHSFAASTFSSQLPMS